MQEPSIEFSNKRLGIVLLVWCILFAIGWGSIHLLVDTNISASSQSADLGPDGLLSEQQPGWHSQSPPKYPESIQLDFKKARTFHLLSILPQDGNADRAPKKMRVEISDDGKTWHLATLISNACPEEETWRTFSLSHTVSTRHLKLVILSNCGHPDLLTLRGLKLA